MSDDRAVLVTGAAGLLGRRICRRLAERHRVFALDVADPDEPIDGVEYVRCDLTDDASVRETAVRVRDDGVSTVTSSVHLAAHYDFSGAESELYDTLTVQGTRRMLHAFDDVDGIDVAQFVFASSALAMRPAIEGFLIDEASPERAEWPYPQSKLDAERVLRAEHGELPVVVLRIAGCYDETCHSIPIAQQIRRIHEKQFKSVFFPGNAGHGQSFVHVDDVADCFGRVVDRSGELGGYELFVVGEPTWLSYREIQDVIGERLHGRDWPTLRIPGAVAKAGAWVESKFSDDEFIKPWMIDLADAHYPLDISRARRVLDWEPVHRLPDTLPTMCDALLEDPEAWYREHGLGDDDEEEGDDEELDTSSQRDEAKSGSAS